MSLCAKPKIPQHIKPNHNKTFPIGTIQTVQYIFNELHLQPLLDRLKHCGHKLTGLVSYKMTEDISVSRCQAVGDGNITSNTEQINIKLVEKDATPGFEIIITLCAIGVAILLWRKKRRT